MQSWCTRHSALGSAWSGVFRETGLPSLLQPEVMVSSDSDCSRKVPVAFRLGMWGSWEARQSSAVALLLWIFLLIPRLCLWSVQFSDFTVMTELCSNHHFSFQSVVTTPKPLALLRVISILRREYHLLQGHEVLVLLLLNFCACLTLEMKLSLIQVVNYCFQRLRNIRGQIQSGEQKSI